nr:7TM GPCR domain containing protein [Haemonchus contortus]
MEEDSEYEPFVTFWPLHLSLLFQVIAGLLSAVLSGYTLTQCKALYFHVNCKTLICGQIVIFIIHSVFIVLIQLMHLWKYLYSSTPCAIVTSAFTCTILRFPLTTSYIAIVILQFMMVLERLIAMFKKADYEKSGCLLGVIFLVFGVVTSTMVTLWSVQPETFSNFYSYCSSGSTRTIARLTIINISLCVICVLSLTGTLLLKLYNKYALERKTYSLGDSFHLRENQHIIQFLYPLSIYQGIFLFLFTSVGVVAAMFREQLSVIIFRTIFASTYVIPYYTASTPLVILWIINEARKQKTKRLDALRNVKNERELYFSNCSKLWNKA